MSYWQWLSYQQFLITPIKLSEKQQIITINRGDSINLLAKKWSGQGVISNSYYLKFFCVLNPEYKNIKAGEYQLGSQETPLTLLQKLSDGKVIQYAFTIIEGMNSYDILKLIKNTPFINDDIDLNSKKIIRFLGSKQLTKNSKIKFEHAIEGWLFPDTYYYSKNESATKLLKRAATKMQQILKQQWQNKADKLPYKTPYEALIMASIIEKETGIKKERKQIAGVFVRRLFKKMKLGTDPTVIYGIGPSFNGDITFKDLRTKTPYNTRIIKGLPPTPIAMPSKQAINAALHPAAGDTLYFVADGSGGHYFSKTLQEHNKAVKRYIALTNKRNRP